jgi:membrane protein YqaA with SNARE-associated domain|tara:strand:- start:423 stop:632 length:210 start_codon:yes stop_codon:yes gene_type:complete
MNNDGPKELLGVIFGSIGAASFVGVVLKTILLSTIGAIVGGVVGFLINRWLKKYFEKIDKNGKNKTSKK